MHTYYRVKVVVLVDDRTTSTHDFFKQGPTMVALVLSSFCQRIINAKEHGILQGLDPRRLQDLAESAYLINSLRTHTNLHGTVLGDGRTSAPC